MTVWLESPFDSLPVEGYRKQRYWLMAEAFVRAGHRVVYWTSDFSHAHKRRRTADDGVRTFDLRLVETRPYRRNVGLGRVLSHCAYARTWERLALDWARENPRPDLIVVAAPPIATGMAALRLARRFGARLVVDVQDAWPQTFERLAPAWCRGLFRLLLWPLRRRMERLYRAADAVTGVCERYRELTRRGDYHLAYLGRERVAACARPSDGSVLRLVYVGNLGRTSDLATVVAGLSLLRSRGVDATLDIAGFGDDDLVARLKAAAPSGAVRAHGMLGAAALDELLCGCDVGVVPMRPDAWVGVPNKLCDYVAAGLPVVSCLGGEADRLLEQYGCGVAYATGDAEDLASAVLKARALPPDGARRLFADAFDATRIYDRYVTLVS